MADSANKPKCLFHGTGKTGLSSCFAPSTLHTRTERHTHRPDKQTPEDPRDPPQAVLSLAHRTNICCCGTPAVTPSACSGPLLGGVLQGIASCFVLFLENSVHTPPLSLPSPPSALSHSSLCTQQWVRHAPEHQQEGRLMQLHIKGSKPAVRRIGEGVRRAAVTVKTCGERMNAPLPPCYRLLRRWVIYVADPTGKLCYVSGRREVDGRGEKLSTSIYFKFVFFLSVQHFSLRSQQPAHFFTCF